MKKWIVVGLALMLSGVLAIALISVGRMAKDAGDERPERREIRRMFVEMNGWLGERTGHRTPAGLVRIRERVAELPTAEQRLEAARFFAEQMMAVDLPGDDAKRAFARVDNFGYIWMEALRCLRESKASEQEQLLFIKDALTKYKEACRYYDKPRQSETQTQKSDREYLAKGLQRHFADDMKFLKINDLRILSHGLLEPTNAALRKWFDEFSGCAD